MSAELLLELARVKAIFQLRTIEMVIRGETPSSPASATGAGSQASEVCAAPNQGEQL